MTATALTVRAVGDCVVVERHAAADVAGDVTLYAGHGAVRAWPGARIAASLADPPRLALRLAGGSVVIVDPTSGDVARAVDEELGIAWFSPKNGLLCGFDARGLVRVEAREKRVRRRATPATVAATRALLPPAVASLVAGARGTAPPIVDVCVSPSGKLLLGRVAFVPGNVVACIDAVHDRLEWSRDVGAGAPVVLGVARGHVVIAAVNAGGVTIELRSLDNGAPRGAPLQLRHAREEPDAFRAIVAHMRADNAAQLAVSIAVMRKGGQVSRHLLDVLDGNAWRTTFDDRRGVELDGDESRPGPLLFARLDTKHGAVVVDGTRATTSCFTPRGLAVILANGVAHTLAACEGSTSSSLQVVDGPTNLVALAPHPRGVIALDGDGRAHLLAVDDDDVVDHVNGGDAGGDRGGDGGAGTGGASS